MRSARSALALLLLLGCAACDVTGRAAPETPTNSGTLVGLGEGGSASSP